MRIAGRITNLLVRAILHMSAWLAKEPSRETWSRHFMQMLANSIIRKKHIQAATDLGNLGEQWQHAFPSKKHHPIVRITDEWVEAEIHTECPLRGTGNAAACHRMMEFDRHIVSTAGGEFEVLESQAVTGGTLCRVAMRLRKQQAMPAP